ncbi:P-loop containing nucleoside triphosphate hydrolase protein [Auriculariales sp. MPI-PUGE-AT-0066]|nr:P-loop containing nucleoside triphosphate hydrolase protein [Auriculariales sp. MPI-PUGE-AT-0066]
MNLEIANVAFLSDAQRQGLMRGRFTDIEDVLDANLEELMSRTGLLRHQIEDIMHLIASSIGPSPIVLADVENGGHILSTGDPGLDSIFGGGIQLGMLWELAGESGAGKTQLALQLALMTQIPAALGGVEGSCCILSPVKSLPLLRLHHFQVSHPVIRQATTSLDHIHVNHIVDAARLKTTLEHDLPLLIERSKDGLPIRLVIIDNFTMLLRADEQATSTSLSDRAREVTDICGLLHNLAAEHNLAVIIVNEVSDVFLYPDGNFSSDSEQPLEGPRYRDVAPWFSTAANVPGENSREPALGLAFANQVNVRVLLTKTGRRRILDESDTASKRPRLSEPTQHTSAAARVEDAVLIRHMSVIFSSVGIPSSIDYIIHEGGVTSLGEPTTRVLRDAISIRYNACD